jgi:hypothetical protein
VVHTVVETLDILISEPVQRLASTGQVLPIEVRAWPSDEDPRVTFFEVLGFALGPTAVGLFIFPFFTIRRDWEQTGFVAVGCILAAARAAIGPEIPRDATAAQNDILKVYGVHNYLFVIDVRDFDTPVLAARQLGHHLNIASLFLEIGVGVFQPQYVGSVHSQFDSHFDVRRLEMDTNVRVGMGFQFLRILKGLSVVFFTFS